MGRDCVFSWKKVWPWSAAGFDDPGLMYFGLLRLGSWAPLSFITHHLGSQKVICLFYKMRYSHLPTKVGGKTHVSSYSERKHLGQRLGGNWPSISGSRPLC